MTERTKKAGHWTVHSVLAALLMAQQAGLLPTWANAAATSEQADAIVEKAVQTADAHARALVAEGVAPLRGDVQEVSALLRKLDREIGEMRGEMRARDRKHNE